MNRNITGLDKGGANREKRGGGVTHIDLVVATTGRKRELGERKMERAFYTLALF